MESSPLVDLITSLANLHHTQNQALLQLRPDQVQWLEDLLKAQALLLSGEADGIGQDVFQACKIQVSTSDFQSRSCL